MTHAQQSHPIGVFDSGIGGLSVLRALMAELPNEHFVYLADSAHAPYGERGDTYVSARTHAITQYLVEKHHIKALVVACNTATAAAIDELRSSHPRLPLVGLEPALKPAIAATKTGHIGVIGTRGTLTSAKFHKLMTSLADEAQFVVQPCDGLAHAIERSVAEPLPSSIGAQSVISELTETRALCHKYISAMGNFGTSPGQIDTLVLGCTHYVFVADELRTLVGPDVEFIETGEPVARQAQRLLRSANLLNLNTSHQGIHTRDRIKTSQMSEHFRVRLLATGTVAMLQAAAHRWLWLPTNRCVAVNIT